MRVETALKQILTKGLSKHEVEEILEAVYQEGFGDGLAEQDRDLDSLW